MMSIRQRLLAWLLCTTIFAIAITGLSIYQRARIEANQLFDYHLKQIAMTLQDHAPDESDIMGTLEEEIDYDFVIQIWSRGDEKRYLSHPHKALPPRTKPGYQTVATDEGEWRVFSMKQNQLLVQVSQPIDIRTQLATKFALSTMMPALFLLLALGILIWFIVGRGLRPLEQLASAVRASDVHTLKPISPTNLPSELRPLAVALNDLLERLERALQTQREFVADAAHELRTPLTALQLQAQLAERATTAPERLIVQIRSNFGHTVVAETAGIGQDCHRPFGPSEGQMIGLLMLARVKAPHLRKVTRVRWVASMDAGKSVTGFGKCLNARDWWYSRHTAGHTIDQ